MHLLELCLLASLSSILRPAQMLHAAQELLRQVCPRLCWIGACYTEANQWTAHGYCSFWLCSITSW